MSARGTDVGVLRLTPADTRKGKEVFFGLESSGRGGWADTRLVAWRAAGSPCRRPRILFRFDGNADYTPPPGGHLLVDWHITLRDYSSRHRGKEIRVEEWYTDKNDPVSEPTILRRSFYRYNAKRDRHTRYSRTVKRNQQY